MRLRRPLTPAARPLVLSSFHLDFMLRSISILLVAAALVTGCSAPIVEKKIPLTTPESGKKTENYRLQPSDIVKIDVFQEEDMSSEQRVSQDGTVNFPLIGRVQIAGLSVEGASGAIAERLKKGYLMDPQVTVTILEYAPQRFSILGQVNQPGSYEIPNEEILRLPAAVAMAGGNTRIGNLRRILITRTRSDGLYEITVNLLRPAGRQFIVEKSDVITVPESLF